LAFAVVLYQKRDVRGTTISDGGGRRGDFGPTFSVLIQVRDQVSEMPSPRSGPAETPVLPFVIHDCYLFISAWVLLISGKICIRGACEYATERVVSGGVVREVATNG
jgi:hypothetical protein